MGALVDSLRDAVADGKTDNKDEAIDNIKETLQLASRRLLNSAKNGDAELDVKDLKDLASVYTLLNQTDGNTDGATGTPQAPAGISGILDDEVEVHKTPDGDEEVDQDDLLSLSSDDVGKMVANQFKKQNGINYNGDTGEAETVKEA